MESNIPQETFHISDLKYFTKYFKDEEMFTTLEQLYVEDKKTFLIVENTLKIIIPGLIIKRLKVAYEDIFGKDTFAPFLKQIQAAPNDESIINLFEQKLSGGFEGLMNLVKNDLKEEELGTILSEAKS